MAVTFVKIPDFFEAAFEFELNLASDVLKLALSNTAPGTEASPPTTSGNGIVANVTQISYANYTDNLTVDRVLEGVTSNEVAGVYTLDANDVVITASGGALPDFRYIYVFDDTSTTPADALLFMIDNGAAISLASGESVTIAWNASGILTVT